MGGLGPSDLSPELLWYKTVKSRDINQVKAIRVERSLAGPLVSEGGNTYIMEGDFYYICNRIFLKLQSRYTGVDNTILILFHTLTYFKESL